jgi:hypothetical protein
MHFQEHIHIYLVQRSYTKCQFVIKAYSAEKYTPLYNFFPIYITEHNYT